MADEAKPEEVEAALLAAMQVLALDISQGRTPRASVGDFGAALRHLAEARALVIYPERFVGH